MRPRLQSSDPFVGPPRMKGPRTFSAFSLWLDSHLHRGIPGNHDYRGGKNNLLLDADTCVLALLFNSGLLSSHHTSVKGVTREEVINYFSQPLRCNLDGFLFHIHFFIISESPVLFLEILSCLNTVIYMHLPLVETEINPEV